jgi:hypothetical protein
MYVGDSCLCCVKLFVCRYARVVLKWWLCLSLLSGDVTLLQARLRARDRERERESERAREIDR